MDITFLSFVLVLLSIGLVMLFSASYAYSYTYFGNSYRFIAKQAGFAVFGVAIMILISKIDYNSILLPLDSNEFYKEEINNIGHSVMKNKFEYALELLNTIRAKEH